MIQSIGLNEILKTISLIFSMPYICAHSFAIGCALCKGSDRVYGTSEVPTHDLIVKFRKEFYFAGILRLWSQSCNMSVLPLIWAKLANGILLENKYWQPSYLCIEILPEFDFGLILKNCVFSQTSPKLWIFLHRYIRHICDILQLWSDPCRAESFTASWMYWIYYLSYYLPTLSDKTVMSDLHHILLHLNVELQNVICVIINATLS